MGGKSSKPSKLSTPSTPSTPTTSPEWPPLTVLTQAAADYKIMRLVLEEIAETLARHEDLSRSILAAMMECVRREKFVAIAMERVQIWCRDVARRDAPSAEALISSAEPVMSHTQSAVSAFKESTLLLQTLSRSMPIGKPSEPNTSTDSDDRTLHENNSESKLTGDWKLVQHQEATRPHQGESSATPSLETKKGALKFFFFLIRSKYTFSVEVSPIKSDVKIKQFTGAWSYASGIFLITRDALKKLDIADSEMIPIEEVKSYELGTMIHKPAFNIRLKWHIDDYSESKEDLFYVTEEKMGFDILIPRSVVAGPLGIDI